MTSDDDFRQVLRRECIAFRLSELILLGSCLLAPGSTQNNEFVVCYITLQTIGQMFNVGPMTLFKE